MRLSYAGDVSHGAWLTYQALARSRPYRGGLRHVGRSRLANRVRRTTRQVSRYVAELRQAGYIDVHPPRKVRTEAGWRTVGVNRYRLSVPAHRRTSVRGDMGVTPPPSGSEGGRSTAATPTPPPFQRPSDIAPHDRHRTYAAGLAAARAALRKAKRPR